MITFSVEHIFERWRGP